MKILVVTPYLPHPLSGHGGGEYVYGLVKYLSVANEVTLVSFASKQEMPLAGDLRQLPIKTHIIPRGKGAQKSFAWNISLAVLRLFQLVRSIVLWQPYYVSKFRHPRMAKFIEKATRENAYDIVQIEFSQMAQYVKAVHHAKTVLRSHDVVFRPAYRMYTKAPNIFRRFIMYIEWCRWSRYEPRITKKFDRVLTFTRQDQDLLRWLSGKDNVSFGARGIEIPAAVTAYEQHERFSMLFIGAFNHSPNLDAARWLCEEIFPQVVSRCPQATLYLIGRYLPESVLAGARPYSGIRILGFVEDIGTYYNRASLFIAPIRLGGGIKTKIIHAQSYGLPVVTTPKGIEGIEGQDDATVIVRRSAAELANAVVELFSNPVRAATMAKRGRESAAKHYAWPSVMDATNALYSQLTG